MAKCIDGQKTNMRKAHCVHCGTTIPAGMGVLVKTSRTDYKFFCESCFHNIEDCNNGIARRQDRSGLKKECKHGFLHGIELEENVRHRVNSMVLVNNGFVKSWDGSTENEYISGMLPNINGISKLFETLEAGGFQQYEEDGAHIHTSNTIYSLLPYADYVLNNYSEIFRPAYDYIANNPDKARLYFGRSLCYYCKDFGRYSKRACFNTQKLSYQGSIELRIPRYRNNRQYVRVIFYCRDIYSAIYNGIQANLTAEEIGKKLLDITVKFMR